MIEKLTVGSRSHTIDVVVTALNMVPKKNYIDRFVLKPWHCFYLLRGKQRIDIMDPDVDLLKHVLVNGVVSQNVSR